MAESRPEQHHELWEDDCRRGIRIADWSIETCKRPILSAQEIDECAGLRASCGYTS